MFAGNVIYITVYFEMTVFIRKIGTGFPYYMFFVNTAVILQRFNCYELEVVFFSKFPKFVSSHHCSVVTHDFTAYTALLETGQAHKINSCFSVAVSYKNAACP